jgi:hypothetical protein
MTLGAGWEGQSDLAAMMSAGEDRFVASRASSTIHASPSLQVTSGLDPSDGVNTSGGSSYSPDLPLTPSSAGLTGVLGANETPHPAVLQEIRKLARYEKRMGGKPYPNVLRQRAIAKGYITPTDYAAKGDINKGWNAAAQPGPAPGMRLDAGVPIRDIDPGGGGLTYQQALNYDPAPLTDHLGSLRSMSAVAKQTSGDQSVGPREMKTVALPLLLLGGLYWWMVR